MRQAMLAALMLLPLAAVAEPSAAPTRSEKIKVAVMDLKSNGVPEDLASTLTSVVASELSRLDVFSVISRQEIRALLSHDALRQAVGCDAGAACTTDVGAALGVRYVLSGDVGKVGDEYTLNLALTDAEKASVEGRQSATVKESSALLETASRSVKMLVSKILSERRGSLIVTCAERGATVKVDGTTLGTTPLPRQTIGWGPHQLEVEKKGFIAAVEDFTVQTNGIVERGVTLIPSPDFLNEYEQGASRMRIGAWITSGLAVAALAGATYFQVNQMALSSKFEEQKRAYVAEATPQQADFDALSKTRSQASQSLTLTYVLVGAAAACAGGSAFFWIAGSDPDRYSRYRGVQVGANGGGLQNGHLAFDVRDGGGLVTATFSFR
jgi:TolB-like protein